MKELAGHPSPTTAIRVGNYALEFGSPGGTFALFEPQREQANAGRIAEALAAASNEPDAGAVAPALDKFVEDAATVTQRCEKSVRLFNEIAAGKALDPKVVSEEIDALLDLLGRLDRAGRHKEALRLARALAALLALFLRWLELVRSLRLALRSARAIGDGQAEAWALHELGSLHLGAGDATAAADHLSEALRIKHELGGFGRCASRHNLDAAQRDRASLDGRARVQRRRRLRLVGGGAALALFAGGGLVLGLSTSHAKEAFAGGTTPQITSTRPPDPGHGSSGPSGPLAPPPTGPAGDTPSTKPANPTAPPEPAGPSQPTPPPVTSAGDTKTPELTLTLQPAGPFIKTQTPTFSGTAGRANGDQPTVTIRIYAASGELQSTLRTAPRDPAGSYSVAPDANSPLPEGEYTARAEQRDEAGNVGQAAVTFTVDVTKPVLAIASPKDGASTFETTPTFGGTAGTQPGDNQQVSVVIFETPPAGDIRLVRILETLPPATPDQRGIWSVKSPTALATGVRYTARATQTDRAGNTGSVTATFSVQSVPR